MGDYMRGVQDCLEYVLMMMKECRDLKDLKTKIEELLKSLMERKYKNLQKLFEYLT